MTAPEQPQEKRIGTGISDAALLRALAEDVPDMALEVREQLRDIADYLGDEVYETSDAAKAECASTNPTMSIPVRGESPAPSASDPSQEPHSMDYGNWIEPKPQEPRADCAECKRLRRKVANYRRSLRQLNKAHVVLWKVIGLYMDRLAELHHGK